MSIFNAPARPLGPPPEHFYPQPGCIVYSDDGRRIWCTNGRLVIQKPGLMQMREIPLTLLDWKLNDASDGWAYLEVLTDDDGIATTITPKAGAAFPATVRARNSLADGPGDGGQNGAYYLPLARLAKGNITPFLAGLACLYIHIDPEGATGTMEDVNGHIMDFVDGKAMIYTP